MLTGIRLRNFKCFSALDLECSRLNLLTGINGTGKSSVIQMLLMLRQSIETRELLNGRMVLSGSRVELGTGVDVLYENAEADVIELGLSTDQKTFLEWDAQFEYSRSADELEWRVDDANEPFVLINEAQFTPPFGGNLVYVDAERVGPRKTYPVSDVLARQLDFGSRGEFAWNYLNSHQDDLLGSGDPRRVDSVSRRFGDVVELWLQNICPGAHLQLEAVPEADAVIAGFSFDRPGDVPTRRFRATNVGFGLSYALPVIVAMMMPSETLCLIENPEAHLHPLGQTKLAELAVRAAMAGVQVFVETHSDHFIDGIRIAVREGLLTPDDVAIHYFERQGNESVVRSPVIDSDGRLSEWPAGFFDQHEMNLVRLLRPIQGS